MKNILFVIMFMFSVSSLASGFQSEKETRSFADSLMDQFIAKKFDEALSSAKPYWPIPAVEIDGMANKISQQWPIVDQRFGQSISKEFLKEKRIGKSFLRYYYLHKFEKHSIYWQIDFYKPKAEWRINSIIFLDQLETLYE
jgi:hypothetical protein